MATIVIGAVVVCVVGVIAFMWILARAATLADLDDAEAAERLAAEHARPLANVNLVAPKRPEQDGRAVDRR